MTNEPMTTMTFNQQMETVRLMAQMAGALRVVQSLKGEISYDGIEEILKEYQEFWGDKNVR